MMPLPPYHLPISTKWIDTPSGSSSRSASDSCFWPGKAGALENADGHAAGGGIPQGLVKGAAGAGTHCLELRVRKALLVVAGGIRKKGPVHCGEVDCGLGGSGEANECLFGILHAGSAAQILETHWNRF